MNDPVYVINIVPGHPMFAGFCPREVADFWVREGQSLNLKIAEIDPRLKSEYADFLVKSR
jgi:hypothetical protein